VTLLDRPVATGEPERSRRARHAVNGGHDVPGTSRPAAVRVGAVVLVVLVGVGLRGWAGSSLWLDEAISVDIARLPLDDLAEALRHDGHPPVYYALLHGWTAVVGEGDTAVRALSGLIGVATLPVMWCLGRRLGGRGTATIALVLTATSPFAIRYATEARMYALVVLLAAACHLAVLRAEEAPRLGRLAVVAGLTTALVLTHYWGAWLVAAALVLALVAARRRPAARRAHLRVAAALVAGCAPAAAWLPIALDQAASTGTPWARSVEPFDAAFDTLLDLGGGKWLGGRLAALVLVAAIGLALAARPVDRWRVELDLRTVPGVRREAAIVALTMALGVGAAVATDSAFQPRYAAVVVPSALLVVAVGVGRIPHDRLRGAAVALLVVAGLAGAVRAAETPRTQGAEVAAALDAGVRPGDVVAYCPDQLRPSVEGARAGTAGTSLTYPGGSPPGRIDWVDYTARIEATTADRFVADALARAGADGTVWLVFAEGYRGFGDACEDVRVGLGRARGAGAEVVAVDESAYEHHLLERFDPR
jgi:mannosyltransferase